MFSRAKILFFISTFIFISPTLTQALSKNKGIDPNTLIEEYKKNEQKRITTHLALGSGVISYNQDDIYKSQGANIFLQGSASRSITENMEVSVSGFASLTAISPNQINLPVRFFELNARFRHALTTINIPWELSLNAGLHYATMYGTKGNFGYEDLIYPQLFPSLRRNLDNQDWVAAYLIYTPIAQGFSLFNLDNQEISAGFEYVFLAKEKNWSINLDFSQLKLVTASNSNLSKGIFNSANISVGLYF